MSIIIEDRHEGEPWLLWKLGNWTAIDSDGIKSLGLAWLFKDGDTPTWNFLPRITGNASLFYNAIFFLRIAWPFGIFMGVRWSGSTTGKSMVQCGVGWKINGRFTALLRAQSDASSAAGSTGPNTGQATGWYYGTH